MARWTRGFWTAWAWGSGVGVGRDSICDGAGAGAAATSTRTGRPAHSVSSCCRRWTAVLGTPARELVIWRMVAMRSPEGAERSDASSSDSIWAERALLEDAASWAAAQRACAVGPPPLLAEPAGATASGAAGGPLPGWDLGGSGDSVPAVRLFLPASAARRVAGAAALGGERCWGPRQRARRRLRRCGRSWPCGRARHQRGRGAWRRVA